MENNGLLGHKIYIRLEEDILNGKYSVGETLGEQKISEEYGVSRTPVREAIKRLEAGGLVRLVPNKGAIVLGMSSDDMIDMYEIRRRLEPLAAKWATERITEESLQELLECVDLWEFYIYKNQLDKLSAIDFKFHTIIYHVAGSRLLAEELNRLLAYTKNIKNPIFLSSDAAMQAHKEHQELLSAIENKDSHTVEGLMEKHIENAMYRLLRQKQEDGK